MSARTVPPAPRPRRRAESSRRAPATVLLLHGMGGGIGNWDPLTSLLAPHLELWDVRLPWAIGTDPEWARDRDVKRWVTAPIEHIRRDRGGPDVVVAHSFAANLVLELLAGTDLLAATPTVLISPFYRGPHAVLDWDAVAPVMRDCYARFDEEIRVRRGSRVSDEVRQAMVRRAFELMGAHPRLRFHESYHRSSSLRLERITTPLLLIGGGDDVAATVDGMRRLGARVPHMRVEIIEGCGHFPMTDRAADVARLIESFIDRTVARKRPRPTPEAW
jgi:pimeloyl-ACP methyl ester carboxylesterase